MLIYDKMFRERKRPRPAEIRKWEHRLSVAISNSDHFHGTMNQTAKFQTLIWFPHTLWHESRYFRPGLNLAWKIIKFHGTRKNWRSSFLIAICFMVLCIIPSNFRPIAKFLTELEREHHSGWTDRWKDGPREGWQDAWNDKNTRQRRWQPRVKT